MVKLLQNIQQTKKKRCMNRWIRNFDENKFSYETVNLKSIVVDNEKKKENISGRLLCNLY